MSTTPQDPEASDDTPGVAKSDDPAADREVHEDETPAEASTEEQPVIPGDDDRTRKIFELRNKIASGEYEIDAETIARRIRDDI